MADVNCPAIRRENDATLLQPQRIILKGQMGFSLRAAGAENDAVEPVVADYATPQSIVQIEHQTLTRSSSLCGNHTGKKLAIHGRRFRPDFLLSLVPSSDIEPRLDAVASRLSRDIEQSDTVFFGRLGEDLSLEIIQSGNYAEVLYERREYSVDGNG